MIYTRHAGIQLAWLAFSVVGIGIAIYLTIVHYSGAGLVCSTTGLVNCERVLASSYSTVPMTSIPITFPGIFWFSVSGVLALAAWRRPMRPLLIAELIWSVLGMLTIFYLLYAEIVVVHAICAWCTVVHALILVMFLLAVVQMQRSASEVEEEEEEEVEVTASSLRD